MNITKLKENAIPFRRQTAGAAGFDIYACLDSPIVVQPNQVLKIGSGIAVALPKGTVGLVFARSSLAVKQSLIPANAVGVIDEDYRGEVIVAIHNFGNEPRTISPGDRIAQLVIVKYKAEDVNVVSSLDETDRGSGGFGSTGK